MKSVVFLVAFGWVVFCVQPIRGQQRSGDWIYTTDSNTATIIGYIGVSGAINVPLAVNGLPVTSLAANCFLSAQNITNVVISDSVTYIGDYAFSDCQNLATFQMGNSVVIMGYGVFINSHQLAAISLSTNLTSIPGQTFWNGSALTNIVIPVSVTNIGNSAFAGCDHLTNVVIWGNSPSVGTEAFTWCIQLRSVYFMGDAPSVYWDHTVFVHASSATIYYLPGLAGWGSPTFDERPAQPWIPLPTIGQQPQSITTNRSAAVTLNVGASSLFPMSYQWLFEGNGIAGATNSSLTISNLTVESMGSYAVVLTNVYGAVTSAVAVVSISTHTVAIQVNGQGSVNLSPDQTTYLDGTVVNPTAVPAEGWAFVGWGGDLAGNVNPTSLLLVGGDKAIQAQFQPVWQFNASAGVGGTVAWLPYQTNYLDGTVVSVTAVPSNGFIFTGWTGATNTSANPLVLQLSRDTQVQANFYAPASIMLDGLSQTYDGTGKTVTVTTIPSGLGVNVTFNGVASPPINAGSYKVIATVVDPVYRGSTTNTLTISKAPGNVMLGNLSQTYDGSAKPVMATTSPGSLRVALTYNDSTTVPVNAGSYAVVGTIQDPNYTGSAIDTLVIGKANGTVVLGGLSQAYDGNAKPATAATAPNGLPVTFTYNGSPSAPTNVGSYTVIGSISSANYQGDATNTLVILPVSPVIFRQPESQSVEIGTNAMIQVLAMGSPLYYQWFKDQVPIRNANKATLAFDSVDLTNSGNYLVVVSNALGSVTSANALLVVRDPGAPIVRVDGALVLGEVSRIGSATLTMENTLENGIIYYTLDGNPPDFTSTIYSAPIEVTSNVVVRALSLEVNSLQTAEAPDLDVTIIQQFPLRLTVEGQGKLSADPWPGPYVNQSTVRLTAQAGLGWVLDHWSGDASGTNNPLSVTMDRPRSIAAIFIPLYTLTATTQGGGSASPTNSSYSSNSVATITATPQTNWVFLGWAGDGTGSDNPLSLAVDGPKNLWAIFGTTVGLSVIGHGQIELNPTNPIAYDTVVRATAIPEKDSYFVQWGGASGGTNNPTTFSVTSPTPIRAVFGYLQPGQVALTVRLVGPGQVEISPRKQVYSVGESVMLRAVAQPGVGRFTGWTGDALGSDTPLMLTLDASKAITANFGLALPNVQIALQDGAVQLTWPSAFTNYALICSATLNGGNWVPLPVQQVINGAVISATIPLTNNQRFFRLKSQP